AQSSGTIKPASEWRPDWRGDADGCVIGTGGIALCIGATCGNPYLYFINGRSAARWRGLICTCDGDGRAFANNRDLWQRFSSANGRVDGRTQTSVWHCYAGRSTLVGRALGAADNLTGALVFTAGRIRASSRRLPSPERERLGTQFPGPWFDSITLGCFSVVGCSAGWRFARPTFYGGQPTTQ